MALLAESAASYTHPGRRRSNQDAVVVRRLSGGADLVAVADGMGGHAAGEVASSLALEALVERLEAGDSLQSAFVAANDRVHAGAQEESEWHGMGTTLVALLHRAGQYHIGNIGDSRAYAVSADGIRQLTVDHSYTAEAVRSGAMTLQEATRSPWRNALTRTVGTDAAVEVDVFGPFSPDEPHLVLLCSDGLYKAVSDELIREFLLSIDGLETAVETLAALAFRRGSDDNISVAAVEFGAVARRSPTTTLPLPIQLQSATRPAPRPGPVAGERPGQEPEPEGQGSAPRAGPAPVRAATPALAPLGAGPRTESPRRRRRQRRRRRRLIKLISSVIGILMLLIVVGLLASA